MPLLYAFICPLSIEHLRICPLQKDSCLLNQKSSLLILHKLASNDAKGRSFLYGSFFVTRNQQSTVSSQQLVTRKHFANH